MNRLHTVDHPLIEDCLGYLRARETDVADFRRYARLLTQLLCFEATRDLALRDDHVETPLERAPVRRLADQVVLVPVLRSGLAMLETVGNLFPGAKVGFVGLERDEETAVARGYYRKLPSPLAGSRVMILEPMLATGGSACATLEIVTEAGATDVRLVSVVAAPEGVAEVERRFPECSIYCAVLDRGLNGRKFILPGLGDFGDRYFGTA
ncbi:MAG TPA: uracil phosphoribosyltransferase [Chloroflexota bacterium]|nr:uracil phosphoribosyltransferase [Chloroflexota bacterium]